MNMENYETELAELRTGRIKAIGGPWDSGLWQVSFEDGASCHIESGYGVRTIAQCYGNLQDARGKPIRYYTDSLNVMTCFEPIEDEL